MGIPQTSTDLPRYQLVIDGRRVEAASGHRYDSVDPFAGAAWASAARACRAVGPADRVRPRPADAPAPAMRQAGDSIGAIEVQRPGRPRSRNQDSGASSGSQTVVQRGEFGVGRAGG